MWLRIAAVAGLAAALLFGYNYIEQRGYNRCQTETQAANLKLANAYINRLTKAEEDRDANQTIIDRLVVESHSLHVHFPVCPATDPQNPDGTAGLFSKRVDESFRNLQERGTVLFERCEALNADAIKVNSVNH